jgi:ATP-binding cassette subfamily F protein uup
VAVLADLQDVAVRRVDRVLFEGLSLTVSDGDRIGVVGINGTGKSTLLRLVAGVDRPDEGEVRFGRGARIGFLEQVPVLAPGTVRAAVGAGWEAEAALDRLGMGGDRVAELDIATLSGGQAKRVALARVLAHPAELLVLDEPTNHLDLGAVAWLEQRLLSSTLVLVTHDRHLLDRVTTRMLELDRGRAYMHEGGYGSYLAAKAEREEQAASAESTRRNLARRELAWLRRGAQARSRKPQARIDAAVELIEGGPIAADRSAEFEVASDTPRLGDQVIECRGVSFSYGGGAGPPVLSGVDLVLSRRDRLGIVGANGTGKSTLLDLLAGRRAPTAGRVEVGPTVVVGYYDQHGTVLDLTARVQDLVAGPHGRPGSLADVALMKRFLFTGELPFARVGSLSGGERRRLQLLLVIAGRPNVLFLDEPTNDLDLDTLRVLEDFLDTWPGALVVVSHDRTFLEMTTDRLVAVGPDGSVAAVPGGVAGWVSRLDLGDGNRRRSGALPTARPAGPSDSAASTRRPSNASPVGRQLRQAEKELTRLQRQRDKITEALTATTDYVELTRLGRELTAAQDALREAEEVWLALAEHAEGSD